MIDLQIIIIVIKSFHVIYLNFLYRNRELFSDYIFNILYRYLFFIKSKITYLYTYFKCVN